MTARSVVEAVEGLSSQEPTLKWIYLIGGQHTDAQLAELADCLLARPDVVEIVMLGGNQLTDETGVKLARYVAASSTVRSLRLQTCRLGEPTYLALAAALRVNSSLEVLHLAGNQAPDKGRIDAAFIDALRLNPDRLADSEWLLYSSDDDFARLSAAARLAHPSLRILLAAALRDERSSPTLRI